MFDHLAHIPEPEGVNHSLFAQVRALIDHDGARLWSERRKVTRLSTP